MFITTANQLEPIPPPLRDRMEIINLAGYTIEEKLHIARNYLVPRQLEANGLKPGQVTFKDEAIIEIISALHARGRRAQPRARDRHRVPQARARGGRGAATAAGGASPCNVKRVHELLGRPRVFAEVKRRTSDPGVATGLAWTPVGGDILFIEATAMPGNGHLTVTGQLGDVMKESAQAALSYVRAHSRELGIDDDYFQKHDIHIHVPAGAIPKDGPSAGVTMATAICSLVTGTPVNSEVAMTGEITLTGQVLPIGGLKEKTLAAQRAGITTVILPSRNEADLEDVPEELRKGMTLRARRPGRGGLGGGHGPASRRQGRRDLAEASELLEEASELLAKARGKTAAATRPPQRRAPATARAGRRQGPASRQEPRQGRGQAGGQAKGRAGPRPGATPRRRRRRAAAAAASAEAGSAPRRAGRGASSSSPRPFLSAARIAFPPRPHSLRQPAATAAGCPSPTNEAACPTRPTPSPASRRRNRRPSR